MTFSPAPFFVHRWQFTLIMTALLALLGLFAFVTTPRSEDPHFPIPIVAVKIILPGASPSEMEQLVAKRIEDALDGLDEVTSIKSTSSDGVCVLQIEFSWGVDPARKYDEVVREVNALRASLPAGVTRIDINRARTTEVAIFQAALVSDTLPMRRLEKVAHRLRDRLNRVNGVREAKYWGAPAVEVRVAADLGRLAQLRLPPSSLTDAIRAAGDEAPVGVVHAGDRRLGVKSGGAFKGIPAVEDVAVANQDGEVLRVADVAKVSWETDEPEHLTYFNGKRAIFITATQKDFADVTSITRDVNNVLAEFEQTLPAGVKLERSFYQADNVKNRLDKLYRDFAIAIVLVLITLLPLGWRAGIVVMVSIPMSLLIGLALTNWLGFSLNQLTISGFVLSLGLLVDDSIVVTENISRRIRDGESRVDAAIKGTEQIFLAVIGCTACLMLGFLPLMALPEGSGGYIKSLPVAVFCTVGASFFVSITIIPFLASRLLPKEERHEGNRVLQWVNRGIQSFYRPVLHRSLENPKTALVIIGLICLTTIPIVGQIGTSLFPEAQTPQFLVRVELPDGTALRETERALRFTERVLAGTPSIKWVSSNLGHGNPQVFYNLPSRETDPKFAELFVSFDEWKPDVTDRTLDTLRSKLSRYPGARISVVSFQNGPPVEAPVAIRLTGDDLNILKILAAQTEKVLRETEGARDVFNPLRLDRTDLNLGIDESKAAALGVRAGDARRIARLAISGESAARFRDADGDDYPVKIRLPMNGRNEVNALEAIYVPSARGESIPLNAIATPSFQTSPPRIDRYNRERTVTVTSYVETGVLTSALTATAQKRLQSELILPPGYRLSLGGDAEAQAKAVGALGTAILVAVFGILAVLILEFGRFRSALVVAGIVPLGVFGAVAALWLTGNSLSFTAIVGTIALIGIEIKNSILLVDFAEQLRAEGVAIREAIERAGEVRFLPVLLTSVTAIGGLIPLALEGSGLYSPLAIAIIGGLVASTVLSRIATPVMYLVLSPRRDLAENRALARVTA
jgi:multidrug efflux pump subunit AcrB